MSNDVFPDTHEGFHVAQATFVTAVTADPAKYGITAAEVTDLTAKQTPYAKAHQDNIDAHKIASAAAKALHTTKSAYEQALRAAARRAHAHPAITPETSKAAGLQPHRPPTHH